VDGKSAGALAIAPVVVAKVQRSDARQQWPHAFPPSPNPQHTTHGARKPSAGSRVSGGLLKRQHTLSLLRANSLMPPAVMLHPQHCIPLPMMAAAGLTHAVGGSREMAAPRGRLWLWRTRGRNLARSDRVRAAQGKTGQHRTGQDRAEEAASESCMLHVLFFFLPRSRGRPIEGGWWSALNGRRHTRGLTSPSPERLRVWLAALKKQTWATITPGRAA